MEKACKCNMVLLFMDASHFVMGCDFLSYFYGKECMLSETYSERRRYYFLGILDFVTKKVLTVTNHSYITVTEVPGMLRKILESYIGKGICLVLDNARYQKCAVVQKLATYNIKR